MDINKWRVLKVIFDQLNKSIIKRYQTVHYDYWVTDKLIVKTCVLILISVWVKYYIMMNEFKGVL